LGRRSRKRGRTEAPVRDRPRAPAQRSSIRRGYARGEARNQAIREGLEPLAPGERPGAVTAAAIVATAGAAVLVIGYATGLIEHRKGGGAGIASSVAILVIAAWGLWRARYWAVLGFQALLGVTLLIAGLSLAVASNLTAVVLCLAILGLGGWLFWKLIKAMARIQMPERPAARSG
jgi:hypothetical protein